MRFERLLYVVVEVGVFYVAEIGYAEEALCLLGAFFGNGNGLVLSVDDVVPVFHFFEYAL